jgi:hypothetical protein
MSTSLKIEKGIPIPENNGSVSATIKAMKVGDSVLVNQRQRNCAFACAHINKIKLKSRTQPDGESIRIWRMS